MTRDADKSAALALRGLCRRTIVGPGRQTRSADATTGQSRKSPAPDRAKRTAKIDVVLFVPSHSAFCRRAEFLLLVAIPFCSLLAVIAIALQVATR